ncbi:hypothetical protein [Lentzea sp. HUAS12]|uniref:hypothetical protein n=1 Tax=Lentzea sp. HUAS12 TaxID=2951806 RepID=UPI00209D7936|nr:hypothetical protein [Lentzea sp. HUAS12]USX56218.1 hypothetical protein ND450_19590 [Lentzea sp. HUAS12]
MQTDVRERFALIAVAGTSALSEHELATEPLKWLKYLVMDRVGLEPIGKIASQISRFALSDTDGTRTWIREQFSAATDRTGQLVVIKIVPWGVGAQLANYRLTFPEEIDQTLDEIQRSYKGLEHELWCCGSSVGRDGFNLGGRLTYPGGGRDQFLELVWYGSPRKVESALLPDFDLPYLRAVRSLGGLGFTVETLRVPDTSSYPPPDNRIWIDDLRQVARMLATRAPAMADLVTALHDIGAQEICFCFKVSDGRLTIIDWDTEIESSANDGLWT